MREENMPVGEGMESSTDEYRDLLRRFEYPILIVSTIAGKGNVSVAEAIKEELPQKSKVYHISIEEIVPLNVLREDLLSYKFISDNMPILLNLIYRVPVFYYRKFFRERISSSRNIAMIKERLNSLKAKTVICISHRAAFWLSSLKIKEKMDFRLLGVATEFGKTHAWKYIFWKAMDGYMAPMNKADLDYAFPEMLQYCKIAPPCRQAFRDIAKHKGEINKVLLAAGYWGQIFPGRAIRILKQISRELPQVHIIVVCGTNKKLYQKIKACFKGESNLTIYGMVDDISGIMKGCASVITKPGFSTIVEANAARRSLFLLKGMPVAEDHNADYAIRHFGAKWFSIDEFKGWYFQA